MPLKQYATQYLFNRYFSWRLEQLVAPKFLMTIDFPPNPQPRWGYGKPVHSQLEAIIARGRARYEARLRGLLALGPLVEAIASNPVTNGAEPSFSNHYYSGLDAIALMGIVVEFKPRTLLEIGSGNSTRFARKSITHHALATRIVSYDPEPRAEIADLSDEVHRQGAETIDPERFRVLGPDDILFIDGSHRVFQNSDVTVLFLEILPRLSSGVIVHMHDIYLPADYPPEWKSWYFSEQYMLATMLLTNPDCIEILLPNTFISDDVALSGILEPLWRRPGVDAARSRARTLTGGKIGNAMWFRVP